jgi:hypothetical protein
MMLQKNRKHIHTRFKLLHKVLFAQKQIFKVFEFVHHVARTVKPHYTQPNNVHSSLRCADCLKVFWGLEDRS